MLAPVAVIACALAMFSVLGSSGSGGGSGTGASTGNSHSAKRARGSAGAAATGPKRATYVVKPGDSFSAIAVKEGVNVDTLRQLNPSVDPSTLQPGQKLKLK